MMKKFFLGVKAIISNENRILLLEKNCKKPFWEAPGGRVDGNESPLDTLHRELQEELPGIRDISIGKFLMASKENLELPNEMGLILFYYQVEALLPNPLLLSDEHKSYQWCNYRVSFPEVNSEGLKEIINEMMKNEKYKSIQ